MASPMRSQIGAAPAEQQLLPDEILEDIFLRLDSGPDLARASAACRAFRRVASGHAFLRRFTSLHPPPLLGIFRFTANEGFQGFHPFESPHPSAPAACAVAQAADFTFSFLPDPTRWTVHDVRGGRFLLSRAKFFNTAFLELAVCDPVFRRYALVPSIPGDLVPPMWLEMKSDPFLAPPGDDEEKESGKDSHFLVICNWKSDHKFVSCVFSGVTGKWRGATSYSFSPSNLILKPQGLVRYCTCSRIYWVHPSERYMLVLDPREMKFSLDELLRPSDLTMVIEKIAIVDAEDGRLGLVTLGPRKLGLGIYSRTCRNNGDSAEEWRHDKFIPLPKPPFCYSVADTAGGYLILLGNPFYFHQQKRSRIQFSFGGEEQKTPYFAVDLKTSLVEKLYMPSGSMCHFHPYARFPPPLSLPNLRNCNETWFWTLPARKCCDGAALRRPDRDRRDNSVSLGTLIRTLRGGQ